VDNLWDNKNRCFLLERLY